MQLQDQIINQVLSRYSDIKCIYLFGSCVKGHDTEYSDLDVALHYANQPSPLTLWNNQNDLTMALGVEIDLVDLGSVSTVFQFQIITTGIRIWEEDFAAAEAFENRTYQLYFTLNNDRRFILEDIAKTGRIYG